MTIPQHMLDTYSAHYNDRTYRAFSRALAAALGLDEWVTQLGLYDERHNRIMNLLIDASFELVARNVTPEPGSSSVRRSVCWTIIHLGWSDSRSSISTTL